MLGTISFPHVLVVDMEASGSIRPSQATIHPKCPNCRSQMFLIRIEPDEFNLDLRTYACPDCELRLTETISAAE